MIHNFNWNKISKTMPVSGLVFASAGTTFFQTLSTKAEENIDLDISLVAVKPNGTQIVEIAGGGKEVVVEITKEQIAMAEAEIAKLSIADKEDSETTITEMASESTPLHAMVGGFMAWVILTIKYTLAFSIVTLVTFCSRKADMCTSMAMGAYKGYNWVRGQWRNSFGW